MYTSNIRLKLVLTTVIIYNFLRVSQRPSAIAHGRLLLMLLRRYLGLSKTEHIQRSDLLESDTLYVTHGKSRRNLCITYPQFASRFKLDVTPRPHPRNELRNHVHKTYRKGGFSYHMLNSSYLYMHHVSDEIKVKRYN